MKKKNFQRVILEKLNNRPSFPFFPYTQEVRCCHIMYDRTHIKNPTLKCGQGHFRLLILANVNYSNLESIINDTQTSCNTFEGGKKSICQNKFFLLFFFSSISSSKMIKGKKVAGSTSGTKKVNVSTTLSSIAWPLRSRGNYMMNGYVNVQNDWLHW